MRPRLPWSKRIPFIRFAMERELSGVKCKKSLTQVDNHVHVRSRVDMVRQSIRDLPNGITIRFQQASENAR